MMRFLLLVVAFLPALAAAQYRGAAVDACRTYALAQERKDGASITEIQFDQDRHLNIERYTRKAGSQFISSILSGNGGIVIKGAPAIEMSFLCLLADDKRAVLFQWVPRSDAPALAQCRRSGEAASCLEALLLVAEQDLTGLYSRRFIEAREAGEAATAAFRASADAFLAYRTAECARRGAASSDLHKACMVELTRRRGFDLR